MRQDHPPTHLAAQRQLLAPVEMERVKLIDGIVQPSVQMGYQAAFRQVKYNINVVSLHACLIFGQRFMYT